MTPTPEVQPLSRNHRRFIFALSILSFVTVVPLLVFYAIGYRIDLSGETRNIRAVGGMYISAEAEEIDIYIDDKPVEDMRFFQNAAYVQNLDAGLHRVHVQGSDMQTWVKDLPVYAHIVTEANTFNLPLRPQVRLITPYQTEAGQSVVSFSATSTLSFASSTNSWYATSTKATSTYVADPEYDYVESLFASSTEQRHLLAEQMRLLNERFKFGTATSTLVATSTATTTKYFRDVKLEESNGEVEAVWVGDKNKKPYYYCVTYRGEGSTAIAYGSHVMADIRKEYGTSTDFTDHDLIDTQLCRESIRIDRKNQSVQYFDFLPGSEHHIVMQLQDGVYVVEVDDRSWQNVQLLYPGDYLDVVVDGGRIYIKDGDYLLEVFAELI